MLNQAPNPLHKFEIAFSGRYSFHYKFTLNLNPKKTQICERARAVDFSDSESAHIFKLDSERIICIAICLRSNYIFTSSTCDVDDEETLYHYLFACKLMKMEDPKYNLNFESFLILIFLILMLFGLLKGSI